MSEEFDGFAKVNLKVFQLTSMTTKKTLDMRRLVDAIDYYGSIFDPTVVMVATVNDPSGAIQDFPLTGDEIVSVEFQTPNRETVKKQFHIFDPNDTEFDSGGSMIRFMLHMVSLDQIRATTKLCDLGFKGTLSAAVENVMKDVVKSPLALNVESTKGVEHLVIPSWTAWETIEFLRKRAVSERYDTPFYFFEDATQYNFCSLEYLIEQKKAREIVTVRAYPFNVGAGDDGKPTINQAQYRNAEYFKIVSRANVASMINNGGVHNKTFKFDFNNKQIVELNLKFTELEGRIRNPLDEKYHRQFGSMIEANSQEAVTKWVVPHDSLNETAFTDNVNMRQMMNRHFGDIIVSFVLHGDSQLQPGDLVKVEVPRTITADGKDSLSGHYIISNLKHTISSGDMFTHIEAQRFGFSERVF